MRYRSCCSFCQYLVDIINIFSESGELALGDEDLVALKPRCVGSVHSQSDYGWQWRWHIDLQRKVIGPSLTPKDEFYFESVDKPFGTIYPLSPCSKTATQLEKPRIFHRRMVNQEVEFDLMKR
jgi:hypothetical protein